MMSASASDLLTPDDLCAALKISRRTYARLVACGLPPAVTVSARMRRYRQADVEAWMNQRERAKAVQARRSVTVDSTVLAELKERARLWPMRRVR